MKYRIKSVTNSYTKATHYIVEKKVFMFWIVQCDYYGDMYKRIVRYSSRGDAKKYIEHRKAQEAKRITKIV